MGSRQEILLSSSQNPLTFQQLVLRLQNFWADHGCVLQQPYDVEVGAGTMAPETFLRVLGPKPYRVGYVQPSRRPADGRYGENPNRLFKHLQFQVILKPPPVDVQELYLESLTAIGIDLRKHDIKFEEDNWESPTLGAWGIGWQVMLDGLEITQFTYFQQCGGIDLDPISAELTYGLERIAAFLQDVDSIYDITWVVGPDGQPVKYGEIRLQDELQFSGYNFECADIEAAWKHLEMYESECLPLIQLRFTYTAGDGSIVWNTERFCCRLGQRFATIPPATHRFEHLAPGNMYFFYPVVHFGSKHLELVPTESGGVFPERISGAEVLVLTTEPVKADLPAAGFSGGGACLFPNVWGLPLPALDLCLKCSHLFNILDARGAISVTERVGVIARIRNLAVGIARAYVDQQKAEEEGDPASDENSSPKEEQLSAAGS
jgi:tetrameric-type glycyl-tRNA synthetase alpha subunit